VCALAGGREGGGGGLGKKCFFFLFICFLLADFLFGLFGVNKWKDGLVFLRREDGLVDDSGGVALA